MWIYNQPDNSFLIFIDLSREPGCRHELEILNEIVRSRVDCNVVISLSHLEIITSETINILIKLHNYLCRHGRRLVLCNVAFPTKCIFRTACLDTVFNFADDAFDALSIVEHSSQTPAQEQVF